MTTPNGLLAAGADLSPARLLDAYRHGIFPWFNSDDPILWWSPDPRMVFFPHQFHVSRSLAKALRHAPYEVRFDSAFTPVMRACAAPRATQNGTWIQDSVIAAYSELHRLGHAHSIEIWLPNEHLSAPISAYQHAGKTLVGGLYGVAMGRMFFGESMFSALPNTSKIALAYLTRQLARWQFGMLDCQMHTPHLASLGAREMSRDEFLQRLESLINCAPVSRWQFDNDLFP